METPVQVAPYLSTDLLDDELCALKSRCTRLLAEQKYHEAIEEESNGDPAYTQRPGRMHSRQARCRVTEAREREAELRMQIASRLELCRSQAGAPMPGLQKVTEELGLTPEERMILVACLPFSLSQAVAEDVLQGVAGHYYASLSVGDLIRVLDPEEGVAGLLKARQYFRPSGKLVFNGLITVSLPSSEALPSVLLAGEVALTLDAFARITRDNDVLEEEAE